VFAARLRGDAAVAKAVAAHIPWTSTHLVVPQNLVPFLWERGVLGGRTFDVMMTRLPFERLHERLDLAYTMHAESETLHDFRAPSALVALENAALTRARRVITPHREIAAMFASKAVVLPWIRPSSTVDHRDARSGTQVLFPGGGLGRKGAYEMRRLANELPLSIVVLGKVSEGPDFWNGVWVTRAGGDPFAGVAVVVSPAYVEHQPRVILRALAAGVRVVATSACGVPPVENLTIVPVGDYDALRAAVVEACQ